jgi:hypothetical protein
MGIFFRCPGRSFGGIQETACVPFKRHTWSIIREDREQVVALLEQGVCEAILPAVPRLLDGFAEFLLEHGVMEYLERFPDARARRSIPAFFFAHLLLVHRLLRLPSLRQLPAVLFRSAAVLRTLGFNLVQIEQGFYAHAGQRPFDEEAVADFFAGLAGAGIGAAPAGALQSPHRPVRGPERVGRLLPGWQQG